MVVLVDYAEGYLDFVTLLSLEFCVFSVHHTAGFQGHHCHMYSDLLIGHLTEYR